MDQDRGAPTSPYSTAEKLELHSRMHSYMEEHSDRVNALYKKMAESHDAAMPMPSKSSFQRFMRGQIIGKDDVARICNRFLLQVETNHPLDRFAENMRQYFQSPGEPVHRSRLQQLAGKYSVRKPRDSRRFSTITLQYVPDAPFLRVSEEVLRRFASEKNKIASSWTKTEGVALFRYKSVWVILRDTYVRTEKQYFLTLPHQGSDEIEGKMIDRVLRIRDSLYVGNLYESLVTWKKEGDA